jgi:DNA-binding XRE family transcriptional regulator
MVLVKYSTLNTSPGLGVRNDLSMAKKDDRALDPIGGTLSLGTYLRSIRDSVGVTQHQFAQRLGISVQHLCNIEHGRKPVSIDRAEAWANTLGYPAATFVRLSLQDQFHRAGMNGYQLIVKRAS